MSIVVRIEVKRNRFKKLSSPKYLKTKSVVKVALIAIFWTLDFKKREIVESKAKKKRIKNTGIIKGVPGSIK